MEYKKVSREIFNPVNENLQKLAKIFPSAVKDGELDIEALKEELGEFKEVEKEKYELTWAGKQNAKKKAQKILVGKTLKYIPEDSKNPDTTENLYIEGDNLEVLKLLRENYYNSIKMIYIDPPYNTGNDFIYKDNFKLNEKENEIIEGDVSNDDERLIINQKSSNRYHANWLNMMYPRLKVAKDLLSEDGIIFISIDDNEIENLLKICNDIFGEFNRISTFIWKSKLGKVGTTSTISSTHEYIICYAKNISNVSFKMIEKKSEGRRENLRQWGQADRREDRPSMWYPITINGITVYPIKDDGTEGRWRVGQEKCNELLKAGHLEVVERNGKYNVYRNFPADISMTPYDTLLLDEIGTTAKGAIALKNLGIGKVFDYSKPVELIRFFTYLCSSDKDIILDFFSGSATTAHAVMKLNAEDGGNRKFIIVQLPEPCNEKSEAFKAGYKNICEIGKERIRRAGEKIKEEYKDKEGIENLDIGFKVFRVADTNIRWTKEALKGGQLSFDESMLSDKDALDFMPGFTDIDVVYEVMLRQRDVPLSSKVEKLDYIGNRTYMFADSFVVCLEEKITEEMVEKLAAIEPLPIKYIFRDSAFEDDIELKDTTFRKLQALIERNTGEKKKIYTVEFI